MCGEFFSSGCKCSDLGLVNIQFAGLYMTPIHFATQHSSGIYNIDKRRGYQPNDTHVRPRVPVPIDVVDLTNIRTTGKHELVCSVCGRIPRPACHSALAGSPIWRKRICCRSVATEWRGCHGDVDSDEPLHAALAIRAHPPPFLQVGCGRSICSTDRLDLEVSSANNVPYYHTPLSTAALFKANGGHAMSIQTPSPACRTIFF